MKDAEGRIGFSHNIRRGGGWTHLARQIGPWSDTLIALPYGVRNPDATIIIFHERGPKPESTASEDHMLIEPPTLKH